MNVHTRRSDCPISFALDFFGDRWTLLIIRDLAFREKHTFSELLASEEGIARNILSARLASLVADGFIEKTPHARDGRRREYHLTERGRGLIPVLVEMIVWSAGEDPQTAVDRAFLEEAMRDREGLIRRMTGRS